MKKAQVESIIIFFALIIGVFIISIIILKLTNSILTPFNTAIGNISAPAGEASRQVQTSFVKWWDWVIILIFILNIMILLISSFLVDIHPAFLILYIFAVLFLFVFGSTALSALEAIWGETSMAAEAGQMPLTSWMINNFGLVMLGVVILSGVVMYAKFKMFSGAGGSY